MKLLILSSSTGGGHDMRAFALSDWWEKIGGESMVSHPMESGSKIYKFGTEVYNRIQRQAPFLHKIYFRFLEHANLHRDERIILGRKRFDLILRNFKPDAIISMHPHLNHAYLKLAKKHVSNLKFMIYCGEFSDGLGLGFSSHWVNPNADFFFGPFDETCKAAIIRGMPIDKVASVGFILRKSFYQKVDPKNDFKILSKLGLNSEKSFLLLGTGANSSNNHVSLLNSLKASRSRKLGFSEIVVLCGNDLRLQQEVQKKIISDFKVIALPKVCDLQMFCLLRHASCLVGRPGAGLTAEAIASGTPMIFNLCGGTMPQEMNNLHYWQLHAGKSLLLKTPSNLPALLEREIPFIRLELPRSPEILDKIQNLLVETGNSE